MNDQITPKTTADWLDVRNKYNISAEDAPAALEETSTKIAKIVKETIDGIGNAAIDANAFIEDLVADVKEKIKKI